MRTFTLLLFVCLFLNHATGQTPLEQEDDIQARLKGRVVDAKTKEPLPYATLLSGSYGTYTNGEGYFSIKDNLIDGDSLSVSYIGYASLSIAVADIKPGLIIELEPSISELDAVTVLADNEYLYSLIGQCRKQLKKWPTAISKGYFQLATTMDGYPVEVMQTYYNIIASGAGLEELQLKAGRVANHDTDSLFYRSLGTSQGLMRLKLWQASQDFSPHLLQLDKGRLKRSYQLTQRPDLSDANTVHIQFDATSKRSDYFSGEIWIDKATKNLQKLILRHDSLTVYPFFPLRKGDKLGAFDIELIYTFANQQLKQIQWKYDYNHYVTPQGEAAKNRAMSAEGVLLSFDQDQPFYQPRYNISREFGDYQKISLFPYDPVFWENAPSIPLTEKQEQQLTIFADANKRIDFSAYGDKDDPYDAFSRGNLFWKSDSRIAHTDSSAYKDYWKQQIVKTYFKMNPIVQLFLDVNPIADSLRFTSATVFDVFTSELEELPSTEIDAALNIYFDLCEIIRRDMELALLAAPKTAEAANEIYDTYQYRMKKLKTKYWAEVDAGNNKKAMEHYNNVVYKALRINNLESYSLYKYAVPEQELVPLKQGK